ncbi:hypothetical protein EIN_309580 [Entamoeba invadens IP1]|uniref:Uncharacterized protein n=1 Tax=Entamoeba invadens IP1 TaxID=370355 RepID=A0A0A1TZ13_ENTIV|nr:hypothetical protein EIN_309580 [Entamoeba invadens IP1]ELP84955.1 hypothetical protein EIN_309580 [Entamoeba invadens IP1]|eukprot:XP_004184301.1 hypothetical protein EIN_309580 [Entamoeba invadens IP1]
MAVRFSQQLDVLIQRSIQTDPHLMFFGFVVDSNSHYAQFLSTSKFSILLNRDLLNSLAVIATADTQLPQSIQDASACYRKGSFPLISIFEPHQKEPMDLETPHYPHQQMQLLQETTPQLNQTFSQQPTPHQLHACLQQQIEEKMQCSSASDFTSPRLHTPHEVSPTLAGISELSKERIQSLPTPIHPSRLGEPRKKRCTTPNRMVSFQTVKETLDDSTKLKIMSAISPDVRP